jgi:hypothetical protein
VQASAFARSDTTLQLAWVIGGFVGIGMPLMPRTGLGVAVAVLTAWLVFVLATRPSATRPRAKGSSAEGSSAEGSSAKGSSAKGSSAERRTRAPASSDQPAAGLD